MLAVNKSAITAIVSLLVLAGAVAAESASVAGADEDTPRYTTAGELQVPHGSESGSSCLPGWT